LPSTERGFTLVEMVVVLGTLGLIAVVVGALFLQGMSTYSAGQTAGLVIAEVRFVIDHMSARLREARGGSVSVTAGGRRITFQNWNAGTQAFVTHTYRLSGDAILFNDQPMASFIQTLSFDFDPVSRSVTITVVTVSSIPGAHPGVGLPFTLTTRVALRNY